MEINESTNVFSKFSYTEDQVDAKISNAWNQLFLGDPRTQAVYFEEDDIAFIKSIDSNDIRSEGMSYGMMICVVLNKKTEFDKLWEFSKTHMQHQDGERKSYFAWQINAEKPYSIIDPNPAPDGEEYFVTSLLWAARKWGNGNGIFNYQAEADEILYEMIHKNASDIQVPMFNLQHHQVVFTTDSTATPMTDPSYHLPAFYELWSTWTNNEEDREYWSEAARVSRIFFTRTVHPRTGLSPNYANFDGTPYSASWVADHDHFGYDAFRTIMNIAMDYSWFKKDLHQQTIGANLLKFFARRGSGVCQYTLDGIPLEHGDPASEALISMNTTAALIVDNEELVEPFIKELWNLDIPSGNFRYYNGMLYMLALLNISGKFHPSNL